MSAQYDLVKVPTGSNEEKEELLYPRIVSSGTIDTETLIERISQSSTFTPGDLKGALQEFTHSLTEYLKDGYTVELGEIGYFSPSIKGRGVKNKKDIRSTSITFKSVNFRANKKLRRNLRGDLQRSTNGFRQSAQVGEEERLLQTCALPIYRPMKSYAAYFIIWKPTFSLPECNTHISPAY